MKFFTIGSVMRRLATCAILIGLVLVGNTSLTAQEPEKEQPWILLQPANARVKFEMPTKPSIRKQEIEAYRDLPNVTVYLYNSVSNGGKLSVVFSFHDLQEKLLTNTDRQKMLASAAVGAVRNTNGIVIRDEPVKFKNRYLARELLYLTSFRGTVHKISTLLILIENRIYNLSVVTPQELFDRKLADKYFSSFEVISDRYDLPPRPRNRR